VKDRLVSTRRGSSSFADTMGTVLSFSPRDKAPPYSLDYASAAAAAAERIRRASKENSQESSAVIAVNEKNNVVGFKRPFLHALNWKRISGSNSSRSRSRDRNKAAALQTLDSNAGAAVHPLSNGATVESALAHGTKGQRILDGGERLDLAPTNKAAQLENSKLLQSTVIGEAYSRQAAAQQSQQSRRAPPLQLSNRETFLPPPPIPPPPPPHSPPPLDSPAKIIANKSSSSTPEEDVKNNNNRSAGPTISAILTTASSANNASSSAITSSGRKTVIQVTRQMSEIGLFHGLLLYRRRARPSC